MARIKDVSGKDERERILPIFWLPEPLAVNWQFCAKSWLYW